MQAFDKQIQITHSSWPRASLEQKVQSQPECTSAGFVQAIESRSDPFAHLSTLTPPLLNTLRKDIVSANTVPFWRAHVPAVKRAFVHHPWDRVQSLPLFSCISVSPCLPAYRYSPRCVLPLHEVVSYCLYNLTVALTYNGARSWEN